MTVTVWWMVSLVVLPATLFAATIMGLVRGFHPDGRKLLRSIVAVGILLVLCLIPRLLAAPQARPYPSRADVMDTFLSFSAVGLGIALLAFGLGRGIRIFVARGKAPD
jgi:hypothetical protein